MNEPEMLRCPLCSQNDRMRLQYGVYICDRCDFCHDPVAVRAWNNGFKAGLHQAGLELKQHSQ
jgi:ribosomal protein L37AE/L43A